MQNLEFEKCAICGEDATFIETTLGGLLFFCEPHGIVTGLTRGIVSANEDIPENPRTMTSEPEAKCVYCQSPIEEGNTCAPCVNELMN